MVEIVFVLHPCQNAFFGELVQVLRDELSALGVKTSVSLDGFPEPVPGRVYALVPPHEWAALNGGVVPPPRLMERTVAICAEQPGTSFFDANEPLARAAGAVFDISPVSVAEWRRRGIAAERLTLGYTPRWAGPRLDVDLARDVHVTFLGTANARRNRLLAAYAPVLARRPCRLVLVDTGRPQPPGSPGFLVGRDKRALLQQTRVLLNVHASDRPYFEHLRVTEAILSGAVVVSERAGGADPLTPGTDLVYGRPESLAHLAAELADDEDRRREMQEAAWAKLTAHPLSAAAERFAAAASELARAASSAPATAWRPPAPAPALLAPGATAEDPDTAVTRRALKQLRLEGIDLRRRLARLEAERAGRGAVDVLDQTPSYAAAQPDVSVVVALFNHERHITDALDSVARSSHRGAEVVVVDDGSEDGSAARARDWMTANPSVAALLVRHRWNRGLPHARNTALDFARAPLTFVLDADNALYRHGLARLAAALEDDPEASFAYGILQCFDASGPTDLISYAPWDPERLRAMNFIDAMALVRTRALRALGGYATDPRLHGWEDYDLWCGMASRGWRGVSVPEIVGRYRVAAHSMLRSTTQISNADARSVLEEHHPQLMAGAA